MASVPIQPDLTAPPDHWEGLGGYPVVAPQGSSDPVWV
ncbi:hypothetical protein DE4585_01634 [Mycobacteroides salmoniphilum]|uniref:Uncharacterized protein n=1 Tax=Mycobacteroides salmoniphilum TaxID=404941 RepID=A0A4R8S0Y3_9MYCO|nr:hypothetical protein DE4586_03162 [Mycobacteroides salmoniphilum]TDZ82842.1 hypothetical protein DE4585_01634 [Mycobacteroides salmoniphilum]TDZ83791.1 hypothetical protein DE4587_02704 [Mycobacteroides salmoniphilum]